MNSNDNINNILNIIEQSLENDINNIINENMNENINENMEDVKIVLSEESFHKLNKIENIEEECNCPICLDKIETNFVKLKCGHCLHEECGKEWLCNHKNICPICKTIIGKGEPLNI